MARHLWILGKLLNIMRLSAKDPETSGNDRLPSMLCYHHLLPKDDSSIKPQDFVTAPY